ncbi:C2 calcium-dependent membrane targeting, partial [Corchorus capsularis]
ALKLDEQEFLGEATCVVSEIVTKRDRSLTLNLHGKNGAEGSRNLGSITVHAEETKESRISLLPNCCMVKDMFSKSDPFLRIFRINPSGKLVPICKTEVINNNLYPSWRPIHLTMQQFGSKDTPLLIDCFDFNNNGNHTLIG